MNFEPYPPQMQITMRTASPQEAAALTDIAVKAKAFWGYSAEDVERWRSVFLTVSPQYIQDNPVWSASTNTGHLVGFAAIEHRGEEVVLEHLWVLPEYIGQGVGRQLFAHIAAGTREFVFTSDPHADAFYKKMGARKIGDYYSTLQKTTLTRFKYTSHRKRKGRCAATERVT